MNLVKQLLNDEAGFVVSSELVLIATITVIGLITGLSTIRNGVVHELADIGAAIGRLHQGFEYNGVVGHGSATAGAYYTDQHDFCEANGGATTPACLALVNGNDQEEGTAPVPSASLP